MYDRLKRFFDFLLASIVIIILLPLFIPISIVLRFTGEGEIFYFQERVGLANKDFKPATQDNIDKFSKIIQENGFLSLFRRSRGRDINASCGSLANKKAIGNG